jgi:cytoskeletal protein CcmA (bactofilin family)
LFSPESHALDIRKGDAASIPAGTIIDDSVVASPDKTRRNIDIAGTIKGDLVVFGDLITIRGSVEGNVLAFARRVEISGTIGGSLVSAGQTVIVSGHVGRNLVGAGGTVTLGNAAEVASNVIAMAGEAVVEGKTGRDFGFFGGVLDMRGDIARHLVFRGGQASLGDTTRVGGDLIAFAQKEESVQIASGAVIQGKRNISPIPRPQAESRFLTARFYIWQIVRILAAFVAGLLLFKLVPWLAPAGIASGKQWLISGGIGFLVLVSVPLAAIIVGFTVIGLPVALISLALWAAGLYFSKIIVAEFVGRSIMNRGGAVPLLAGLLLVIFAVNLPWIGGLINFLLCLMGLGAIVMAIYRTRTWRGSGDPLAV